MIDSSLMGPSRQCVQYIAYCVWPFWFAVGCFTVFIIQISTFFFLIDSSIYWYLDTTLHVTPRALRKCTLGSDPLACDMESSVNNLAKGYEIIKDSLITYPIKGEPQYMFARFRCDPPILTTPPTALTAHGRGFKFGMDTHLGNTYGVRRRLLKFHS